MTPSTVDFQSKCSYEWSIGCSSTVCSAVAAEVSAVFLPQG